MTAAFSFPYFYRMKFEVGDTVKNSKTNKLYTIIEIEEPYLTLLPVDKTEAATGDDAISMHQDFVELVPAED